MVLLCFQCQWLLAQSDPLHVFTAHWQEICQACQWAHWPTSFPSQLESPGYFGQQCATTLLTQNLGLQWGLLLVLDCCKGHGWSCVRHMIPACTALLVIKCTYTANIALIALMLVAQLSKQQVSIHKIISSLTGIIHLFWPVTFLYMHAWTCINLCIPNLYSAYTSTSKYILVYATGMRYIVFTSYTVCAGTYHAHICIQFDVLSICMSVQLPTMFVQLSLPLCDKPLCLWICHYVSSCTAMFACMEVHTAMSGHVQAYCFLGDMYEIMQKRACHAMYLYIPLLQDECCLWKPKLELYTWTCYDMWWCCIIPVCTALSRCVHRHPISLHMSRHSGMSTKDKLLYLSTVQSGILRSR